MATAAKRAKRKPSRAIRLIADAVVRFAGDSTRAKRRGTIGTHTPSRSRQVAGRQRATVDTSDYGGKIAVQVRALRNAAGLTVDELATKAGIDVKALYAYEQRTRRIPPEKYPALAKALGCKTPNDFFPPLK